ncbi:MAG: FAD:protein FMN transferase [Bacteroidetes bacterium]|nr:FAD:protein FMN transferase [Bacteroidota bacterium]
MNILIYLLLLLSGHNTSSHPTAPLRPFQLSGHAQGTTWHITYYAPDSSVLSSQVDSLLNKIDSSLSLYKPYSLICQFNRAPRAVRMDEHLAAVIHQSLDTYRQTDGLFDITVQPLVEAWGFSAQKPNKDPDSAKIRSILSCIGSHQLSVNNDSLIKAQPCIRIDLDGIAQGYSVDVLASFLERSHINTYLVELGGELRIKGHKPSGEPMRIGIEAPNENAFDEQTIQKVLRIDSGAITTSGSYRAWRQHGNKKISHTIDPHTGYPADNELISVTVFSNKAIVADAYDNVLMLMGLKRAKQFMESRKDLAAYFIYRLPDGSIATAWTQSFNALVQP